VTGLPLASFFIQGQFTLTTSDYAVRLAMIFLTAGTALAMLTNLIFTDSVRQHLSYKKFFIVSKKEAVRQPISMYQQCMRLKNIQ
jgi:hypothetical protein